MPFSIDRTRCFLKIEEPNLLSLYRSPHPIVPSADYCRGHLCEAFICVVHEYNLHRVYVALHDQQLKSNLVFVSDPIRPDEKKLAALLREAEGFLEKIGFEMEEVNIGFSTATREVIIRDIRVMREPSVALQLDAAKAALEGLAAEKEEIVLKASKVQTELKAELKDLKERLSAATAVQQAPVVAPLVAETLVGSDELQKAREELGSVKEMLKSAGESLKHAKDETKQAKKEQKLSRHESQSLTEKLKSEQMELAKARKEIEVISRELQETRNALESALHDREAGSDVVEAAHQAATMDLKAEIDRLTAEQSGKDQERGGEIEVLRAALADANLSLSVERTKNESALQEMDAIERNASVELKSLKKKVDALTAEKQLLEKISTDIKIKAHGEIERQQQVNQLQRNAAIKKLHALKEEIRQLSEVRAVVESPLGIALGQSGKNTRSLPVDEKKENPVVSHQASFASDPFGSYETADYINFLPDKLLKGIPYSFSTDVVEVYRSYNTIQAAPTGKQSQRCDGFVCLVTEGGHSQVYVAWLMNTSGEVLVCLPEIVAEGDDSCQRLLHEGIGYFERMGFVIDRFSLAAEPEKRQLQLDKLSVFCRTAAACAA